MQANSAEHQPVETSNSLLDVTSGLIDGSIPRLEEIACQDQPTYFHGHYASCMELQADAQTVAAYIDRHSDWFPLCAHPMKVEPLGSSGYVLTVGQFGAFGYEVEPKIGLNLLPQQQGVYRIQTVPVPDYESPGYSVDFQAAMVLAEQSTAAEVITRVEWQLNLEVAIHFPRFVQARGGAVVQFTGDRLLNQVVRQVSRRLTQKVQDNFHAAIGTCHRKARRRYPWSRTAESGDSDS